MENIKSFEEFLIKVTLKIFQTGIKFYSILIEILNFIKPRWNDWYEAHGGFTITEEYTEHLLSEYQKGLQSGSFSDH